MFGTSGNSGTIFFRSKLLKLTLVTANKAIDENPKKDRNEEYSASKIHVGDTI